jgi:signal transduction histidine kinase
LLLDEGGLKGKKLEFTNAIKLSADNLMVVINDILDISKIESGKLTVEKIPFDFKKLMLGVKSIFQHKIESAGVKFKYTIDARIPQFIIGDPTRLNQILLNLLSNSEKFTEHGEICLSARLVNKVNQKLKLQFEVKDTGIGIAGKNLEKIFQEFTQESDNTTRLYGGTGLGLAIVKQLVRLQKGEIWVESSKNKGSSFFIEIEYDTANSNKTKEGFSADKLKSASIIMAEDYPMNRLLAKNLFKKWGLNLKIVNNGKDLLLDLDKHQYDVILMDVQMPKMGCIEAT